MNNPSPTYYEFFAGGGMVRAGLGSGWTCLFANDLDPKKTSTYQLNWGGKELVATDVNLLSTTGLPGFADLAWASFPCQDLSLAGTGAGLSGSRSGTFWPFWNLIAALSREGRRPNLVVLENVCGALTSHGGSDFRSILEALINENYRFGALVIDAALFLPQSRPRLFIVGVRDDLEIDSALTAGEPHAPFHTTALISAYNSLPEATRGAWVWWRLPNPPRRIQRFADIVEENPFGVAWHTPDETEFLLSLMSPLHLEKVEKAKRMHRLVVGSLYKRTRPGAGGKRAQRAEVRFDDVAGCLRTPGGGSSRQTIVVVQNGSVKSRLLSPRETARLMGLPDDYALPQKYNDAYHLTGDGVAVPVVRHLAAHILEPLLAKMPGRRQQAA